MSSAAILMMKDGFLTLPSSLCGFDEPTAGNALRP
jgi:hypothetical protein